ncbi:MAG: hypothetical protein WAV90_26690 [Gordonia amarae]
MDHDPQGVLSAIQRAMHSSTPEDVIDGVKGIVAHQVSQLDATVKIDFTDYFNHTYMPDMVMRWKGSANVRPLYIRNRLDLRVTTAEVRGLSGSEPVVMGLSSVDSDTVGAVRESLGQRRQALVSDMISVSSLAEREPDESGSPLMEVVRSSIFRIGRGILDVDSAAGLRNAASRAVSIEPDVAAKGLEDLKSTASSVYSEDGIHQISRVGQLIQSVTAGNTDLGFESTTGQLSLAEACIVVPYILERDDISVDSPIWSRLSSLIDLPLIEDMHELDDLDLTSLVTDNALDSWTATRAYLTEDSAEDRSDFVDSWFLKSGLLTCKVGRWNIIFTATDKRRLKGRVDSMLANWDDLEPFVRPLIVDSADLRGISRRVSIGAEQSGNVVRDVVNLAESIPDTYRVRSLDVRIPGSLYDSTVDVEFDKMTASVSRGGLPVGELGTIVLLLLGHRYRTRPGWLRVADFQDDEHSDTTT